MAVPIPPSSAAGISPLSAGLLAGTTLLSLGGNFLAGRDRRRQEERLKKEQDRLTAMFNKEYYTDPLDTKYGKTALGKIRDNYKEQTKRDEATAAVTGASDEVKVAAKGERAKGISNAITNISAFGEQKKERLFSDYWSKKQFINQQLGSLDAQKAQSRLNVVNNLWGATSSLINMGLLGKGAAGTGGDAVNNYIPSNGYNSNAIPQNKLDMLSGNN